MKRFNAVKKITLLFLSAAFFYACN